MKRKKGLLLLALFLSVTLGFSVLVACGGDKPFALNESELKMEQYEETILTANKEGKIVWESSDPRTVRVEDGKLTSLKLGDATITATLGKEKAICEVTVVSSTKGRAITVDEEEKIVAVGESKTIDAQLKENGKKLDVSFTWATDNPSCVTVENGVVKGVASGSAKITVSTTYKGQAFSKTVLATCMDNRHEAATLKLISNTPEGSIEAYTGNAAELGFNEGAQVQRWNSVSVNSAVWAENVDLNKYERLVLDFSFTTGSEANIVVHNQGDITAGCGGVIGTRVSSVLYYDKEGRIAQTLSPNTVYTLVIDMRKGGDNESDCSIVFKEATTVFVANAELCSNEYYLAMYHHDVPAEPITAGLYMAKLEVAPGAAFSECGERQTDGEFKGMYKIPYMTDIWGERLGVADGDMIGYQGAPALHVKYRQYDYFGFDVVFTEQVPDLTIWTGGYALFVKKSEISAEGGKEVQPDDLYIYDAQGLNVSGQELKTGERYTIKIRIQKDNTDNAAFGLGVPGSSENNFYIGNPFFIKN